MYIGIYALLFKLMHTNWQVLAVGWTLWWFLVWFKVSKYLDIHILVGLKIKYNYFFCVQCRSGIWTILTLSNINSICFNFTNFMIDEISAYSILPTDFLSVNFIIKVNTTQLVDVCCRYFGILFYV